MFLSKTLIPIPSKTLIEDLVLRSGSPTKESLSPYNGIYDSAVEDIKKVYDGSLAVLIASQPDYDADKQKPYEGEREKDDDDMYHEFKDYNAMSEDIPEYPRRMEDIHHSHVLAYLENVIFGVKKNTSNSVYSYNRDNPSTKIFLGNDEEYIEEKDLITDSDYDEYSQYEIQEAHDRVPYLIRRLYDKSLELGVHLISLIKAYELAKDEVQIGNLNRKRNITVQPHHILEQGVYAMGEDGMIGDKFLLDANKNSRAFMRGRMWLYEDSETRRDANELIQCYEVLGIDIRKEDPTIYDKKYVDQLVVAYVTSNIDYVMRRNDSTKQQKYASFGFMRNVDRQLKNLPLEVYEESSNVQTMTEDDTIEAAIRIYIDSPNFPDNERYRSEYASQEKQQEIGRMCELFIRYYNYINHTAIDLKQYYCCDGFFYSKKGGNPLILDMTGFIKDPMYSSYCLLNSNGYLIACAVEISTQYCDIFDMCEHLEGYINEMEEAPMKWGSLSL